MTNLYHGSSISGMKQLEPHISTHGNFLYATRSKELAIIFSNRAGDDMTFSLFRTSAQEPWQLVERIPNGFPIMFENSASIYTIDDKSFSDIHTGFDEVVSKVPTTVLNEERIPNVYQKIQELGETGAIAIYRYPNRPKEIPQDDSDLLAKVSRNGTLPIDQVARLLFLHPNLLDQVNELRKSTNPNCTPYTKSTLCDFFDDMIALQILYPNREMFLQSGLEQIERFYPELLGTVQLHMNMLNQSKENQAQFIMETKAKHDEKYSKETVQQQMNDVQR